MPDAGELVQFLASLAAVAALVAMTHFLGFSRGARLDCEDEARELLRLAPGGFEPVAIALDREGRAAVGRDAAGKLMLLGPHGRQFVVRPVAHIAAVPGEAGTLAIAALGSESRPVRLQIGDAAQDWAEYGGSAS